MEVKTVADAWEFYRTVVVPSDMAKTSLGPDESRYRLHIHKLLGERNIDSLVKADYLLLRRDLERKNLSPQTIHHVLSLLRRILNASVTWEVYKGRAIPNFDKIFPKFDNRRTRYLSVNEARMLISCFDKHENWKDIIIFALNTGLRKKELFDLTFSNINFDEHLLTVLHSKSKKNRVIPLNGAAMEIILKKIA